MSRRAFLITVFSAMVLASVLAAANAQDRVEPADLHFRRVYAPADRMSQWPTGDGKYLPLESAEFERLLGLVRSAVPDGQGSFAAQTIAAEYRAKLVGEQLLNGQGTLEITHSGESATMLPMEPCNVAIQHPAWLLPGQNAKAETKKPILGFGSKGKLQVLVEQNGKLAFDWSVAGQRDSGEAIVFSCEFPACPASVLWLDLPENLTPTADKGLVSGGEEPVDGRRRWHIELGGNCRFHLRLAASGAVNLRPPLAMLRESSVYDFSMRGVDVSVQWKIQTHDEPLDKIIVLLDPGLQLATARLGETPLLWTIEPLPGYAGTRAVISLPEPIHDTERILRLGALAQLTLDRPCRLPRIRPEELFWQEGGITLIVPDPLVIERLMPVNCSQMAVSPLAEPRMGESLQFQKFSADATIELSLARRRPAVQLVTGTAVELGSGQMTARVAADIHSDDTAQFILEADVSRLWIIDSVEATPAESLADWSLESQSDKPRKLLIRLSKAPSPKQPLRLVVNARRLRTFLTQQWGIDDLLPLRFTNPPENKRLAAIQAVDLNELKISNSEQLTRLTAQDLTPAELELFAAPPPSLFFEANAGAAALKIALQTRKPTFSATVLVETNASKNQLQESYILRCVPESAGIDRVIVHLSHASDVPPRWTLTAENDKLLSARQWSKSEQAAAGLGATGEIWELTLRRPRNTPFEIRGAREVVFGNSQAVCLASLPEADTQRGTLIIQGSGKERLHIDNRRLKSIPPEPVSPEQYSTIRATFRFDPVHDVTLAIEPALILSAASEDDLPSLWVWNCRLESWYEVQGGARHLATFEVQNTGSGRMQIVLPRGVSIDDIRGAWVDDIPVDCKQEVVQASTAAIAIEEDAISKCDIVSMPLPVAKRFPTVSIYFTTHESGLRTCGSLAPPVPAVTVPVLSSTWTVWLPPGFDIIDENQHWQTPQHGEITYSRRLFGPFGLDPGQRAFNPFVAADWLTLACNQAQFHPAEAKSSRVNHNPPGCQPTDTQGWIARHLELSSAQPAPVKYVHRRAWQFWAAIIFVLTLSLGYWKAAKRPILFSILTGILGITTIFLPEIYVPLASAAILGMLGCLLLIIIRLRVNAHAPLTAPEHGSSDESPSSASKNARLAGQAGTVLLIVAASVFFAKNVVAEETAEKSKPAASSDYRVFVPIDAEKKPAGDKVYLPEKFYNELYRRAAGAKNEPQGWLLGSAVYRGSLIREAATGRLAPETIKAQFDLHVFGRMALVRIPFRRENAQLISDSATLDGRPIQAQWEADGAAIVFEVDEPGNYRLELGFRPASRGLGASNGFEMSIPRLAQSRLELTIPHEMPGIEAQSAIGAVQLETDPPRLSAELGPSNRLAVHWPETPAKGAAAADIDIDQLMWLKVQPGSVVVDARFKFHIPADQVRRLQIATDPRLRLLPLQGKDAPNVQIRSDGAKKQIVTILWNRPLTEESALDLSFLLTGASGVGKFRLPQIEVLDARTAKRWVAISVNPILEYKSQRSPNLVAAATGEFLKNWGSANSPPAQAYRLESDKVDWSLSTRPREPETSAQQTLALSFDQNNVEAYFDAQLTVASGYVFQYQLSAPAAMKVLKASVCKEGVEQASRCSQDQDGTITIFLTGPADGKQQLSLHGIMPLESGEKMPLPDIKLKQCRVQSTTVQVSRRPEVNLELILPENINSLLQKSPLPTNLRSVPGEGQGEGLSDLTERGRLVDAFRLEGDNPVQGAARLTANRPNIDAKQVTRLYQDGQQWTARTDFLLDVTEGVADGFWIEAPKSWKEPYTVDPPATLKITEIPGETRQLLVQPRSAVRGKYHFSISGALEIEPGEPPAAPEIILRKTKAYLRWYILPRQLKGQPASWETRGLLPSELPAALATPADRKDSFAYEIVSDAPRAVLRAQTVPSSIAKVSIADIQLAWQADGTGFGTAVFDLEPGGQRFCLLNLPDGSELVHVSIDEQPAAPISLEPGKWKLPLVSERLPQRIEVLFRGTLSDPLRSGPRNFIAPSLGNLPVTQTLWTILSPPSLGPEIGNEEKTATLNRQQLIRFRNTAATITSAENLLLSDDAEETLRWYQIKSRRLTSAQVTLQNELALMPVSESSEKLHKEIETIDQQQNEFAKRIGLTKVLTQVKAESPAYGDSTDVWQQWLGEQRHAARYAVDGKALSITVNYQSVEHIGPLGRIAASLCLAGVVFIFILGIRHGTWTTLLENRPYAIGIAAGLAWWCWLWPSILGLIAMIVCLIVCRRARRREAAL